jgi:hypothetical protein
MQGDPYRFGGRRGGGFAFVGSGRPLPRDLVVVMVILTVTWALQFFGGAGLVAALMLTGRVYRGWVWQLLTYPFVGTGGGGLWGGLWFGIFLLMLYWFGRDVFWRLGRRLFWKTVLWATLGASLIAVLVQLLVWASGVQGLTSMPLFAILQGQRMLITIIIAAFATISGESTILLMAVVPMKARWFLWLEVIVAFFALTEVRDLAGFAAVCTAVLITYFTLSPGGPRMVLRRWRSRVERLVVERRLARMKKDRRFDVIDGDRHRDKWVH